MLPELNTGLVLYTPGDDKSAVLRRFAEQLTTRGWRVGGVVLVTLREGNRRLGLDLLELDTGQATPLARPGEKGTRVGDWMLAENTLERARAAIARAVTEQADLVIVDKFGPLEGKGEGLHSEIQAAQAARLPLLVALRSEFLSDWARHETRPSRLLRPDPRELWRWWGAHRGIEELVRSVPDEPVKSARIGLSWTMVESEHGLGLASTPSKGSPGCPNVPMGHDFDALNLAELARLFHSDNGFERTVAMAAINAAHNRFDLTGPTANGLELAARGFEDGRAVVIGRFPRLAEKLPGAVVLERVPGPEDLPAEAASRVIPGAKRLVVTSSAFVNGTMADLLALADEAEVTIVGPGTPLAPSLFEHGVKHLAGLVVEDRDGLAKALGQGAGARTLMKYGRSLALSRGG